MIKKSDRQLIEEFIAKNGVTKTRPVVRYIRRKEVEEITGLSRSTIYLMMDRGEFPRPIKLTGKAVGWNESKILEWLNSRPES